MKQSTIDKLVEMGATRWTKGGKDRLYLNDAGREIVGLELVRYNNGSISCARLDGEVIRNSDGGRISTWAGSAYIDLATDELVMGTIYAETAYYRDAKVPYAEKISAFIADLESAEEVEAPAEEPEAAEAPAIWETEVSEEAAIQLSRAANTEYAVGDGIKGKIESAIKDHIERLRASEAIDKATYDKAYTLLVLYAGALDMAEDQDLIPMVDEQLKEKLDRLFTDFTASRRESSRLKALLRAMKKELRAQKN